MLNNNLYSEAIIGPAANPSPSHSCCSCMVIQLAFFCTLYYQCQTDQDHNTLHKVLDWCVEMKHQYFLYTCSNLVHIFFELPLPVSIWWPFLNGCFTDLFINQIQLYAKVLHSYFFALKSHVWITMWTIAFAVFKQQKSIATKMDCYF